MVKKSNQKQLILLAVVALLLGLYWCFDGSSYLNLSFFQNLYNENPVLTAVVFFVVYVAATALSIPAASLLTLMAGVIFDLSLGLLLVSFASSLGATLAFLATRFLLKDWVQHKLVNYLSTINQGIEKEGWLYLFGLRLIPVFPFWAINLAMALTPIKVSTFYWVSQLGMLPATLVYVNAGAELGAVEELGFKGILTPSLVLSLVLLAVFPFIAKGIVGGIKRRRVYKGYQKPKQFDANLVVIGAGSGGLVSAYIAAAVKAKVILIEKEKMGGDCLNTGCVPSKALIKAAKTIYDINKAAELGVHVDNVRVDFSQVMAKVQQVVDAIAPHDSIERYTELGVDCISGEAQIVSPWQVAVGEKIIAAKSIIIATGASPFVPPISGIDTIDYLTSDNLWQLKQLPERLLVMGAGPIGCELAQAFNRLGSNVTLVDMMPSLLPREDEDASLFVSQQFNDEGIGILMSHQVIGFSNQQGSALVTLKSAEQTQQLVFDKVLVAVGRKANTGNLGLDINLEKTGTIEVDQYLRTQYPNVYAVGDAIGPYQFTHTASHEAWYAAANSLFGKVKKFKVDYRVVPRVTFTDPEIARVGLSENEAQAQNVPYEVTRFDLAGQDRALAENVAKGFIKVLTVPGKDKILGALIVGAHGGELLAEFVTAMKHNLGLNKILGTIHAYPTLSEANKSVAGLWKQQHKPEKLLNWVEKFHRWQRN